MKGSAHIKQSGLALFAFTLLSLLFLAFETPVANAASYPNSMASFGDSITRAFNTGWFPFVDATGNSWSTGTSTSVNSQYLRLKALNPNINGKNYNQAKTGAKMADLNGQVAGAPGGVEYVTILLGANDVCTSGESTMTSVTTFTSQFQTAMNSLKTRYPNAKVFVASIPNIYNLWSILKGSSSARSTWNLLNICQSMLANPSSTASADEARRQRVNQRNVDFNAALKSVCTAYGSNCRYDDNAVFNTAFVTSDVSTRDYFHPSVSGQAKLANVSWGAAKKIWGL
jgi:lysophospholipase L1-like esterase